MSLCFLSDYQKGIFEKEFCFCNNCIQKYKDPKGLLCIGCRRADKQISDRCLDCYETYKIQCHLMTAESLRKENQKKKEETLLLPNQKSSDELLSEMDKKYQRNSDNISIILKKFDNLVALRNGKMNHSMMEKRLITVFSFLSAHNTSIGFEMMQFSISAKFSKQMASIIEDCKKPENLYLFLRILWQIVYKNSVVKKEIARDSDIFLVLNNLIQNKKLDEHILSNVRELYNLFESE